jgi:hypothetical protein
MIILGIALAVQSLLTQQAFLIVALLEFMDGLMCTKIVQTQEILTSQWSKHVLIITYQIKKK